MFCTKQSEKIKKISIIIPIYNEEESLPLFLKRIITVCQQLEYIYELILIDDGSFDNSTNLITQAVNNKNCNIKAIILKRNYGQHLALIIGFKEANGDLMITLDADLQNPPEEILRLIQMAELGYDVVGTKRINRKDSFFRKIASKIINLIIIKITGHKMGDYGCMLRAYRRNIVNYIIQNNFTNTFIPILANTFANNMIEIDVSHVEREYGYSKYNFLKLINLMFDLLISFNTAPLRLLSIMASITILIFIILLILLLLFYLHINYIWNITMFILLSISFGIFIIIEFLNILFLNKYINKIYNCISNKSNFFIKKIISYYEYTGTNNGEQS
uniref:Undecaprenyl-phosphate 4-deoxy-4-formamido-L-arabinose transferase n=1 Tax=Candidatus Aschnera chinzeii TaxID=1485666 RepID=A0AAT9G505_9ENTR|nr:MAG: undecaprenyl-phosphate 4-deoxy-4-formamido-L-arabinose transferase [Candidatus Aschnera chinzeii]